MSLVAFELSEQIKRTHSSVHLTEYDTPDHKAKNIVLKSVCMNVVYSTENLLMHNSLES